MLRIPKWTKGICKSLWLILTFTSQGQGAMVCLESDQSYTQVALFLFLISKISDSWNRHHHAGKKLIGFIFRSPSVMNTGYYTVQGHWKFDSSPKYFANLGRRQGLRYWCFHGHWGGIRFGNPLSRRRNNQPTDRWERKLIQSKSSDIFCSFSRIVYLHYKNKPIHHKFWHLRQLLFKL